MNKSFLLAAAFGGLICLPATAETKVDFVKDIQPILEKSCVQCHGPQKQKGDLRLDTRAAMMKGGKDGLAITDGKADKSELYRRITLAAGDDDIMPSKGDPLTKAQTDLIRDWINQGALWPDTAVLKAPDEATEAAASTPVSVPYSDLTPFKPAAAEASAISKLGAAGIDVRVVAMNITWREANFRPMGTNANDTTIAPVKDVASLVDLNLAGTKVTDAGLQVIEGLTNLETLHLERTGITDAGLAHLKNLHHLAYLNLYNTTVTDQGLEQLKDLTSLKRLYVWQTKVTDTGAAELKKSVTNVWISRGWENEPGAKKAEVKDEKKDDKKEEKK